MKKNIFIVLIVCLFIVVTFASYLYVYHGWPFTRTNTSILITLLVCSLVAFYLQGINEQKKIKLIAQEKIKSDLLLHQSERQFDGIFHFSTTGIAIVNLDGHIKKVNQAFCELLGYHSDDIMLLNFYDLIHPTEIISLQLHIKDLVANKTDVFKSEQKALRKNGDVLWVMSTLSLIRDEEDNPQDVIFQLENITLQKKAEEKLRHMAFHDPLTGLANRNQLEQFTNHLLAAARRHKLCFALLFLDLDRFKNINESIGHEAGDTLLQVVSERLRAVVRSTDLVARLGGDEFVIVVTDVIKTESVATIAQKILATILKAIIIKGQEIYITTSIGISLYPYDGQSMQVLMKNADLALYRAKENGKNNYEFYTIEMTGRAQKKLALQNAIAHAFAKNEFVLHYQPILDLKTKKIIAVEALLRWENRDYGFITPSEIVSLAEETGLIIPVSEWVLKTASRDLKKWHDLGFSDLTVSINCSQRQLKQGSIVDDIINIITNAGLSSQSIEMELTEKIVMEDPDNILRLLHNLRDLGVRIAIDDFGTGYWSLSNLRRLSVDRIKIDKSFIHHATIDESGTQITRAIIAMAKKLQIKTVAEGVETEAQANFLMAEGCDEIQGYYISHPLNDVAIIDFLKNPILEYERRKVEEMI